MSTQNTGLLSFGPDAAIFEGPGQGDVLVWDSTLSQWVAQPIPTPPPPGGGIYYFTVSGFAGSLIETASNASLPRFGGANVWTASEDVVITRCSAAIASPIMSSGTAIQVYLTVVDEDDNPVSPYSALNIMTLNEFTKQYRVQSLTPDVPVLTGQSIKLTYDNTGLTPIYCTVELWAEGGN